MNPEQLKAALRRAGYVVASEGGGGYGSEPGDPFIPGPTTYYYYGPQGRTDARGAAAATGIPEAMLTSMESQLVATPEEASSLYPSRGGGFFSMLTDLVTSPQFLMAGSVIAPSILAAEAAGAAALASGAEGLAVPAAAPSAATPAAAAAPAATAFPVATSPLAPMSTYTAAELAALDAGLGGVSGAGAGANALAPTAAATGVNVANALSPEALAAYDASVGLTAGGGPATLSPEALAAYDASVGLTAGTGAGAGAAGAGAAGAGAAGAGTNALAGYGGAGDVLNPATGTVTTGADAATGLAAAGAGAGAAGAATGAAGTGVVSGYGGAGDVLDPVTGTVITGADAAAAGLTASAFDTLAKFAKDYGVPLASLISGITGSQAAKDAANVQAESAREARQLARDIFNEQKALQEPFRTAGITAQNQLLTLLGLQGGTQGAEFGRYARPFGMQDFQADPGYAFRLSEGLKALEASRAAKGGLLSGATGKALSRYGQDLASQEYGNAFNRYQTERVNRLQPLGALMGTGQAAAANQGAAAGQYGQTAGGLTTDIGAVRAAGDIGAARAISNALSAYGNYMGNQNLAQAIRESQYNR